MKRRLLICVVCLTLLIASGCKRGSNQKISNANVGVGTSDGVAGDRSQAKTLLEKGKELYHDDQDSQALEAFQEAVKLDPDLPEVHFRMALAYEALQKADEAETEYKKAIELYEKYLDENPKDAEAHYALGQTYAGLHQYSEAAKEFRQATKLKTDDPDIYFDLGTALTKLAQYDEATTAFSKCLELDPENYRAEDALEEAREGVKRIKAGKKHQEDLLKKQKADELKKAGEELPASPTVKPTPVKNSRGF